MPILKEFKDFALKGSVIDLAVGVIIGAAFGKIVTSLIEDIITPLILKPAMDAAKIQQLEQLTIFGTVKYGSFLSTAISFIMIAIVLFFIIKGVNATKKRNEAAAPPPAPSNTEKLLTEIRDLLKSKT